MKIRCFLVFLMSIFLLLGCKEAAKKLTPTIDRNLLGMWSYKEEVIPKGVCVYDLAIYEDATFSSKVTSYGIYPEQDIEEIAKWTEYTGTIKQENEHLFFTVNKYSYWANHNNKPPVTEKSIKKLFENCTFSMNNGVLQLKHKVSHENISVETQKEYKKQN